jgi:hypothetical protein
VHDVPTIAVVLAVPLWSLVVQAGGPRIEELVEGLLSGLLLEAPLIEAFSWEEP